MRVILSISGTQHFGEDAPETTELVTEGELERRGGALILSYEESELTGLAGVVTTFRVEPGKVMLNREGALNSRMLFQEGVAHDSLYQMEYGTLMITVKATNVFYDIVSDGGSIDLAYQIIIENTEAGMIDYHLDIRAK